MAADASPARSNAYWLPRLSWPLPGGAAGCVLGFFAYFLQPGLNHDSFAPLFLSLPWVIAGAIAGALLSTLTGLCLDRLLSRGNTRTRRNIPTAAAGNLVLWCLLFPALQVALPQLVAPPPQAPAAIIPPPPAIGPCTAPPPTEARARRLWDEECR